MKTIGGKLKQMNTVAATKNRKLDDDFDIQNFYNFDLKVCHSNSVFDHSDSGEDQVTGHTTPGNITQQFKFESPPEKTDNRIRKLYTPQSDNIKTKLPNFEKNYPEERVEELKKNLGSPVKKIMSTKTEYKEDSDKVEVDSKKNSALIVMRKMNRLESKETADTNITHEARQSLIKKGCQSEQSLGLGKFNK